MFSSVREDSAPSERAKMYAEVPQVDGQHEHDSEDANDEKSPPEYADLYGEKRALERRLRTMKLWLYALAGLLTLSLVALFFTYGASPPVKAMKPWKATPVPDLGRELVTFEEDPRYAGPSNQEMDEHWGTMMPQGDGFIVVKDADQYELQPGKNSTKGPMYDITLFHQLHCLKHIRTYMFTVLAIANSTERAEGVDVFLQREDKHVYHCFDYIRQGLMCNADMTLEWPREEEDGSRFAVDGWGIQHQCTSWSAVMKWMEAHRFHHPWEQDPVID